MITDGSECVCMLLIVCYLNGERGNNKSKSETVSKERHRETG